MRQLAVLVLALAACGDGGGGGHATADAPPGGAPDAPTDTTGLAPVSVVVRQNMPLSGVHVIFTNADSSPVADVFTDDTGTASHVLAPGGYVTVVDPFPTIAQVVGANQLYTIAGVQPGDQLFVTQHTRRPDGFLFTLQTDTIAGAQYYDIIYDCADGELGSLGGGPVYLRKGCTGSDLYALATDASGGIVGSLFHPGLTATQGQMVDLTGEPYVPAVPTTFTYANVPAASVSTYFSLYGPKGFLASTYATTPVTGGAATVTTSEPAIGGNVAAVDSVMTIDGTNYDIIDWGLADGDHALDPTNLLVPAITTPPTYNTATGTVAWTPGATGVTPSMVFTDVSFGNDDYFEWQMITPYTAGSVTYPQLAGFHPAADDTLTVRVRTFQVPGGYDAARPIVFDHPRFGANWYLADGPTGRAVSASRSATIP